MGDAKPILSAPTRSILLMMTKIGKSKACAMVKCSSDISFHPILGLTRIAA